MLLNKEQQLNTHVQDAKHWQLWESITNEQYNLNTKNSRLEIFIRKKTN